MAALPKLPNQPSEEELTGFLSKVDEIESVIKGLNSENDQERGLYMSKADKLIEKVKKSEKNKAEDENDDNQDLPKTKTGFSKTSINKDAYKNDDPHLAPGAAPGYVDGAPVDQRAFMAAMEADAKERGEKRKEREKIAEGLKEQGNAAFKQGNFEKALEFYDKAMEQIRDNLAIYTNRAQARIKLGMFKEALTDCHWALRLVPNSLKAYVHQGHAYLGLKEYENARESYRQILTIDPKKETMVKDYLAEVDRTEQACQAEAKAARLFEEGNEEAKDLVELLHRVGRKEQLPLYYAGGFRLISSLLDNDESQTLFRTNGGLNLPIDHPVLKRCLSACLHSLSKEERDVITGSLEMFTAACKNNETNQLKLMSLPEFPSQLLAILEVKFRGQGRLLRISCLNFLHEVSLTAGGRSNIITKFDVSRLISALFPLMMKKSSYANTAAALLNNLALDKKLKSTLRDNIQDSILPALENLLTNNKTIPSICGLACSTATNLSGDVVIRNKMAARSSLWSAVTNLLVLYQESALTDAIEYLLGLLMNLSTGVENSLLKNISPDVASACYNIMVSNSLSELAVARSLAVLSNIGPHCEACVKFLSEEDRPLMILEFMKREDISYNKSALKCMTALTQTNESIRNQIAQNKGTSVLLNFLNSEDEIVIGNAALCLSHLCTVEKVCSKLAKTNIIQRLLVLARDGRKASVQSNCAILIGKLAQGDARHLERLRELRGIEILHGCMKHVK